MMVKLIKKFSLLIIVSLFVLFFNKVFSQPGKNYEFAGSFYPANPLSLDKLITDFISQVSLSYFYGDKKILGIISPHAGYVYSGKVAAHSYKIVLEEDFDTVIILAPTHRYYFEGVGIYPQGLFDTPLGKLQVDNDLVPYFSSLDFVRLESELFSGEHSIEVQLPFIKKVLPQCKILPIVFGRVSLEEIRKLVDKIYEVSLLKNTLVVVSTDLSHYYSYEEAKIIDSQTISYIENEDFASLWESFLLGENRACGMLPIITFVIYVKEKGGDIIINKYDTSATATKDSKNVVGYLSAIGYCLDKKEEKMSLTKEEKLTLLNIARSTLENYLEKKEIPEFKVDSQRLWEKRGVFVTLKKHGQLRGCIGRTVAETPLYKTVSMVAIDSALNDPRFPPVTLREMKDIEIEISLLTPFERVKSLDEIKVGVHGLLIQKGFYSGLLLPQVPLEYGWDKKTYLEHLCLKAGLPTDAYK
ncbi:MAG: AmmeMemoRadiSam system protein B, partial [Candidatus Omnitrophica bacterium]|nr:AmmeMemoRadiSam system protein B [Candidatus Omnitrophota bacterium]